MNNLIVYKKAMKKILAIISCSMCLFLFSACTDDFAPYQNINYDISNYIDGDIFIISDVEKSVFDIALKYVDNISLSYVEYTFFDENDGDILFQYKKCYEKDDIGYTTLLNVYVNICTQTAYKVEYIDGISKRVSGFIGNYIGKINCNAFEIYNDSLNNSEIDFSDVAYIKVIYSDENVGVNYFDDNNVLLCRKSY